MKKETWRKLTFLLINFVDTQPKTLFLSWFDIDLMPGTHKSCCSTSPATARLRKEKNTNKGVMTWENELRKESLQGQNRLKLNVQREFITNKIRGR